MVSFASSEKVRADLYRIFIGAIVPRPIAFVASCGLDGKVNLAPFSFFNGVTINPPTLAFTVNDRGTMMKDTSRNIQENPEFVVHIVGEALAEKMNITCGDYGAHIDEFVEAGLTPVPSTSVNVPRVAEAMVAFECRTLHHLRIGKTPPMSSHILGEIIHWHVSDSILDERGRVNADLLKPVGRMGGVEYTRTADRFAIERPVVPPEDPRSIPAYQASQGKPEQK